MKDRLTTFAAAAAALLLTFIILSPPRSTGYEKLSLPTTEDSGTDGLKGLKTWLATGGIPVASLRKRYPELLNTDAFHPTGNILLISLPHYREALKSEWPSLASWIANGNTLFILGHAYRESQWADTDDCLCDAVRLLKRFDWKLSSSAPVDEAKNETATEKDDDRETPIARLYEELKVRSAIATEVSPLSTLPIAQTVFKLESDMVPASLDEQWRLETSKDRLALRLFALNKNPGTTMMWQIETGQGQIFLSLVGDIFSNAKLNRAGNARLLKNLLALHLAEHGQIIFDDYHFGLSDLYDPEQFFNDARLHRTFGLIVLFWFLYVLGYSNRLAPVRSTLTKISALDAVEAMAGFFAGRLDQKLLARELTRHLLNDIRMQRRMPDEASVWHWLDRHPQIADTQLALLRAAVAMRCSSLNTLTDTLTDIRNKTLS